MDEQRIKNLVDYIKENPQIPPKLLLGACLKQGYTEEEFDQVLVRLGKSSVDLSKNQNLQSIPVSLFSRVRNNILLRLSIFTAWITGQILLSYIAGSEILKISLLYGLSGLKSEADRFLNSAIIVFLVAGVASFIVFLTLIRLVTPNWKRAILATFLSYLVLVPTAIWIMPRIALQQEERKTKELIQLAEKEENKYLNTIKISNKLEQLVDQVHCADPQCADNKNKFLLVSFDIETQHEGSYSFLMDLGIVNQKSFLGRFSINDLEKDSKNIFLNSGTHHLEFVFPTQSLIDHQFSGPYQIDLTVWLINEEVKKAHEKNWHVDHYILYEQKDFYRTKAYTWQDFYNQKPAVKIISHTFRKELVDDKIGFLDVETEVFTPGIYKFPVQINLTFQGNPEVFTRHPNFQKELATGEQKFSFPISIYDFSPNTTVEKAQKILASGYDIKIYNWQYCLPGETEGNCHELR